MVGAHWIGLQNRISMGTPTYSRISFLMSIFQNTCLLYPRYEVYRGYIVFAFSVIMFVCLSVCLFVCLSVNFFFSSKISQQLLGLGF